MRKRYKHLYRSSENAKRPARDVGKAEYCEANGKQVMHKCDRCRHRSSENAGRLAAPFPNHGTTCRTSQLTTLWIDRIGENIPSLWREKNPAMKGLRPPEPYIRRALWGAPFPRILRHHYYYYYYYYYYSITITIKFTITITITITQDTFSWARRPPRKVTISFR